MLRDLMNTYGIEKVNTMTKYPSILTYHNLGERGTLVDSLVDSTKFGACDVCYVTEKINGTNARIVGYNGEYLLGSRDELIYVSGDFFGNPTLRIIDAVRPIANYIPFSDKQLTVVYGEVYGGKVTTESYLYTAHGTLGFRVFDIAVYSLSQSFDGVPSIYNLLKKPIEQIASWRDHGGQNFMHADTLYEWATKCNDGLPPKVFLQSVPSLCTISGADVPVSISDTYKWLKQFSKTQANINAVPIPGRMPVRTAEGVVIRTADRTLIRKLRFDEYEKTLGIRRA